MQFAQINFLKLTDDGPIVFILFEDFDREFLAIKSEKLPVYLYTCIKEAFTFFFFDFRFDFREVWKAV